MTRENLRTQHLEFKAAVGQARWNPGDHFAEARLEDIFPHPTAPLDLDLGCGDGTFLTALAARHPERNYLGTERLLGRVEKVSKKIVRGKLANARILRLESHYAIRWMLPAGSASIAYLLHPDPWPKRHHHHRRVVQTEFMESMHRVLIPGGEFRVKTDDKPYFMWMEKVFAQCPQFERLEWEEPADWPKTDFEQEFLAKGMPIYRARLRKI